MHCPAVNSAQIIDATIAAADLADGSVTTTKLAAGAVVTASIADSAVLGAQIADGTIAAADLADGACLAELLDNDGAGSGLDADLLDGQQGNFYQNASNLNAGTVADGRLSANVALLNSAQTVSGAKTFSAPLASTVATGTAPFTVASTTAVANLNADLLDGQHGAYYSVSTHNHDAAYVNEGQANSITSAMITDGQIALADLADSSVNSAKLADGTVALADLAANAVDGSKIVDGSVALADLATGSVNSAKLVDGSIALADLAASSVDSSKIVDASIATIDFASSVYAGTGGNLGSAATVARSDHRHGNASTAADGFMSATDKDKLDDYSAHNTALNCVQEYTLQETAPSAATYNPSATKRAELLSYGYICWDRRGNADIINPNDSGIGHSVGYYGVWTAPDYRVCGRINYLTQASHASGLYILSWSPANYFFGLQQMGGVNTWHVVWASGGAASSGSPPAPNGDRMTIWTCR